MWREEGRKTQEWRDMQPRERTGKKGHVSHQRLSKVSSAETFTPYEREAAVSPQYYATPPSELTSAGSSDPSCEGLPRTGSTASILRQTPKVRETGGKRVGFACDLPPAPLDVAVIHPKKRVRPARKTLISYHGNAA